jgi:4-amino-4-deoxy-L-arabinose transferase-like glycosyltransferase
MPAEPASGRVRLLLTFAFGLIALAALVVRIAATAEPLGIDQSLWASAVRGMARGQRLYHEVWEQRPPGIYWIYLAGFRLFGWRASTVAWLDILAAAATTVLLFQVARVLSTRLTAGLAAALFAALTMPAWLYGHGGFLERSVCETFIVVCVAAAAWSATAVRERGSTAAAIALGLFSGAAVVLKPNAGLYFPALLIWIALYRDRSRRVPIARLVVVATLAGAVLPAAALFWLWRLDLLHDARVAVIDFNRFYVSQGFTIGGYLLDFSKAVWLRIKTEPLWLAGVGGSVMALWDVARRRSLPAPLAGLGVIWGAAAALVIVVNGARLFNSYFINALPPLALMGAWMLADAWRGHRVRQVIAAAAAVVMVLLLVQRGYADRVLGWGRADLEALRSGAPSPEYLERFGGYANDRGYSARANAELADYVRQHTGQDERIFLFGINGAGVYFASDRLTAHRFLRVNFFVGIDFPDPAFRLEAVTADLAASRPVYIIFERLHSRSAMGREADNLENVPAVQVLLRGYRLETRIEDFTLYRRAD